MKIQNWPVDKPVPYGRNPRAIPQKAVDKVAASITEFGFRQPIVVDEKGVVIVGHTRLEAAKKIGLAKVPVHVADGLSKSQAKAYRLADNRLNQDSGWDPDLLGLEIGDLEGLGFDLDLTGFDPSELNALVSATGGDTDEDDAPALPDTPVSRLGDVWACGGHRLLCGDATRADDVGKLLNGARADMVFTDPPYGVGYDGGMKKRRKLVADEVGTGIYAAALPLLRIAAADHAALYLWYADAHAAAAAAAAAGYKIVAQIIWVKNHAQFVTAARYKGKHEPCFYAHRKGKRAQWLGPNNEVTVWECDRAPRNDYHPTQKPVALAQRAIRNSSRKGDAVYDPFVGSGTTIIAAETIGRVCYAIDIDPVYVDVAVQRWQNFTGEQAILNGKDKTFAQVEKARQKAA